MVMTSNPLAGSRPGRELAAHIGAYSASKAIKAGWDALRALIAARPDLVHPGVADYVAATVLDGAIGVVTGDAIRDAETRGYARAVAALRDDARYTAWQHAQAVGPAGARTHVDAVQRDVMADYLEVVAPEGGGTDG